MGLKEAFFSIREKNTSVIHLSYKKNFEVV